MSRQIQMRRGSADEHKNFTGAPGEITVDTTHNTIRVHDGVTAGGTELARAMDIPTPPTAAQMAHAAMPGTRFVNLSLGANKSSYIAPADGYVYLVKIATAINSIARIVTNGIVAEQHAVAAGDWIRLWLPVAAGDKFIIEHVEDAPTQYFRFVYAKGAE